jgi:hypothetical protein
MKLIRPKINLSANVAVGLATCMHCVGIDENCTLWKCSIPHEKGRGYANVLWVLASYDGDILDRFEGFSRELPEKFLAVLQQKF